MRKEMHKLSHGEEINRRRILAETRQKTVFDVDKRIIERRQAEQRLKDIEEILTPEDRTLSVMNDQEREQTRTGLEIEGTWLQLKLGIITPAEKQQLLTGIFDELEKNNPNVYNWLVARNEHGLSMAERIRDKVMPPIHIGRYYTKR